ncbi:MAG: hypothetical protein K6T83_18745 [Alicyclobacillus sp.]|nr:hypothetical protein [Alicyclobacillus sp.]
MTVEQLRDIEHEEILRIVRKQQDIGLRAVTDGEFRRSWWHFDFLEGLDGVEGYAAESGIQFHQQQTKSRGIRVVDKLDFSLHPVLEDFQYLRQVAGSSVAKMTFPSPSILHLRGTISESAYGDLDSFFDDLARAYAKAIQASYLAGCRYLQPLEQLCLSPQCEFASTEEGNLLTEDEQRAKLEHVVNIAADVWK